MRAPMRVPDPRKRLFLVLLLVVAVYRFSLLDRGTSAFVDETLYFTSVMALQSLASGDIQAAARHIADARGRQGAAILQLPVAALQAIPSAFGVPASNPRSLIIPTAFNVLASLATLFFFFKTAHILTRNEISALVAATLYALLVNTNLYVRHVLPYEWSLCAGACAMWLIATRPASVTTAAAAGALAAAVMTLYTGYYLFAAVIGAAFFWTIASAEGTVKALRLTAPFVASTALVFAAVEVVCRVGDVSYFASSKGLARTIAMGSFEEGWTFLPEYLLRVERLPGVVLLCGTVVWFALLLRRLALGERPRLVDIWMMCATGAWMVQALLAAQFHVFVLYGRLLHPWMLFLALAVAASIAAVPAKHVKWAAGLVVAVSVVSFVPSALAYRSLSYPSDVLYALGIDTARLQPAQMWCEFAPGTPYASPGPLDRTTRFPYHDASDYILINFCQDFSSGRRAIDADPADRVILYEGPHWLTSPAYTYEGFMPDARKEMVRRAYRVRAFGPRRSP